MASHSLFHAAGIAKCKTDWKHMFGSERVRLCPYCSWAVGQVLYVLKKSPLLLVLWLTGVLDVTWTPLHLNPVWLVLMITASMSVVRSCMHRGEEWQPSFKDFDRIVPFVGNLCLSLVLGFLLAFLFFLPAINFMVRNCLAAVAVVADNKGPAAAIQESYRLTKGKLHMVISYLGLPFALIWIVQVCSTAFLPYMAEAYPPLVRLLIDGVCLVASLAQVAMQVRLYFRLKQITRQQPVPHAALKSSDR